MAIMICRRNRMINGPALPGTPQTVRTLVNCCNSHQGVPARLVGSWTAVTNDCFYWIITNTTLMTGWKMFFNFLHKGNNFDLIAKARVCLIEIQAGESLFIELLIVNLKWNNNKVYLYICIKVCDIYFIYIF